MAGDFEPLEGEGLLTAISAAMRASSEQLMLRAQEGDADAFGQLYDRHWSSALAVAQAICHNRSRAEEAVQEGFLSVWRGRGDYDADAGSFKAWSMTIVRYRAIDVMRRAGTRKEERQPAADLARDRQSAAEPESEAIARDERDALLGALGQLPSAQAEVIALAYYGGLTHTQISTRLGLPAGTVKGRMRLGLDKLRAELED